MNFTEEMQAGRLSFVDLAPLRQELSPGEPANVVYPISSGLWACRLHVTTNYYQACVRVVSLRVGDREWVIPAAYRSLDAMGGTAESWGRWSHVWDPYNLALPADSPTSPPDQIYLQAGEAIQLTVLQTRAVDVPIILMVSLKGYHTVEQT